MNLVILDPDHPEQEFPILDKALTEPDGLIAVGGCLSLDRLVKAYRHGIFPWYNEGEPILWWSPDPRLVLFPEQLTVSRSLRKALRKNCFIITYDQAFDEVVTGCATARKGSTGTWITQEIRQAYNELHKAGLAHSVEAWHKGNLVGGLYGVAIGQVFFGESMFHVMTNASKVAFAALVADLQSWNFRLIDCQVSTRHLASFGAIEIDRSEFISLLNRYCDSDASADTNAWR